MFYQELNAHYSKNEKITYYYQAAIIKSDQNHYHYKKYKYRYDIYYSYYNYQLITNKYQSNVTNMITFFATEYDEDFIKLMIDYYEPVTHMSPPNNIYIEMRNGRYSYYNDSILIDNFIQDKEYSIENFIKLLIHIDKDYINFRRQLDMPKLLESYSRLFNVPNKQEVIESLPIRYTRPLYSDLTAREAKLITELKDNIKKVGKDNVKLVDKIYEIMSLKKSEIDETMLVKDYKKGKEYKIKRPLPSAKLPLKTLAFYDYVNKLTIKDLKTIYGKVPSTITGKAAIAMSEDILNNNDDQDDYTVESKDVLKKFYHMKEQLDPAEEFQKSYDLYTHNLMVNGMRNFIANNSNKGDKYLVTLLNMHFDKTKTYNVSDVTFIFYSFCRSRDNWITNSKSANYIVEKMFKEIGVEDSYNIIMDVIQSDISFTPAQWLQYIENIEEYKDMPASWSSSFIK